MAFAAIVAVMNSCLPERQVADAFIRSPHMITIIAEPADLVLKYNHKGEEIPGFDSLTTEGQDSALWWSSRYVRYVDDSILLENYVNRFIEELRVLGFDVILSNAPDTVSTDSPQSYRLAISQVQLDEYLYPLQDEESFLDTVYLKTFNLNAVDFSCWFNLNKAGADNARKTLLYATNSAYDDFEGRFFNDPFAGTVRYRYSIDTLRVQDIYVMATYLGKKHAGYLYDFFLNQYIARHLPEGMEMEDYFHYDRKRNSITPAYEDRFEILGIQ